MTALLHTHTTKAENSDSLGADQLPNIIVFSKDRAAQLDLFLRSFMRFFARADEVDVRLLYTWSTEDFRRGYEKLFAGGLPPNIRPVPEKSFKADLLSNLDTARPYTVFFVDDDVFLRSFDLACPAMGIFRRDEEILCCSLRLHPRLIFNYPQQLSMKPPEFTDDLVFQWAGAEGDYGYPMSVDGHVFRTADILPLLAGLDYRNPNTLEAALARAPLARPKMICGKESVLLNVPANRVQMEFANIHAGIGVEGLNRQFLAGQMIDLEPFAGYAPWACHEEVPLHLVNDPRAEAAGRREALPPAVEAEPAANPPCPGGGPKVTVIICARNAEAHVRGSLESALGQTLRDIEIVCVDNGSTDGTVAILEEYRRRDDRIRVLAKTGDEGLLKSRKDAVAAATGDYIQFLDSDDTLEPDACATLHARIVATGVEILHFPARVESVGELPANQMGKVAAFIAPHLGRLEGAEVFRACFVDGTYRYTLWNKLFSADLCKRAFAQVPDAHVTVSEDLCAYFIVAFLARSYEGMAGPPLHRYRFGGGLTGRAELDLAQFAGHCAQALVAQKLRRFLEEKGVWSEYWPVHEKIRREMAENCAWSWLDRLAEADRPAGFDLLVNHWGAVDAVSALFKAGRMRRTDIARGARGAKVLACRKRSIRTIGTYYNRMRNGGVERVISKLIPLWLGLGCEVVLFTNEPPHADDYLLPKGVKRVVLATASEANTGRYHCRAEQWARLLEENKIDVMIYHEWMDSLLLPDLLSAKCQGIPFVILAHGVFSFMLTRPQSVFGELAAVGSLSDAVVGLSRVDRQYWASFALRAFYLPNPATFDLAAVHCSALDKPDVVWVGRISREKNPLDALRIMELVARRVPAARLLMVGKGQDEKLDAQIAEGIERMGLRERVVLCGYHQEVGRFYEQAAAFLSTSSYEGFTLALAEAKSHGLPSVMYDIPQLEMIRDGRGVRTVPQGDVVQAAEAIIALLENGAERRAQGRAARESMEDFAKFDLAAGWREALTAVVSGELAPAPADAGEETARILLQTLLGHLWQGEGVNRELVVHQAERIATLTRQRDTARELAAHRMERIATVTRQRDVAQQKCARLSAWAGKLAQQRDRHAARIQELRRLVARFKGMKKQFESSLSWRVTRPLRALGSWWGGRS